MKKLLIILSIIIVSACSNNSNSSINNVKTESEAPTSVIVAGSIETRDGKDLFIKLVGGASNNFGELPFKKGESFTLLVTSEEERALEIGLMSISTEQVYSELVRTGTGTVVIPIPEDGKYRVYVNNKSSYAADFELKLSKAIEGPIV